MTTEAPTRSMPVPALTAPPMRPFLLLGFSVWLVATVAFRFVGQFLLDPSAPLVVAGVFVVVVPVMYVLALLCYRLLGVSGGERLAGAVALVLPGMLLDTVATAWFDTVFPNMLPGAAKYFGGMLLLSYATVLLSGFTTR